MKKLIAVLSVALVLVFSCVLTSFADDSVVNGYAVNDVPYNEAFEGVLTASDNGSQLYSSTDNKTYNTPSVLAAPVASSSALYTAKSVTDMIPTNIWKSNNWNLNITFPVDNGYTGVSYSWTSESKPNTVYHYNVGSSSFSLKSNRKYRFTFTVYCPTRSQGSFDFYLAEFNDMSTPSIRLLRNVAPLNGGGNLWLSSRKVTIEYVCPNNLMTVIPVVRADVYGLDFVFYINNFTITDITTEDLDSSLDKFGNRIDDIINPSTPYEKWDNGDLKDSKDKLNSAMGELPTVDINAVKELKDSIDISSYSNAFAAINQLFIRVVDSIGVTPLIFFALFFGICIFLIGRKLSGG